MFTSGIDPRKKVMGKGEISFEAVAREQFDRFRSRCTASHAARMWTLLQREVFPFIGHDSVDKIPALAVLAMLRRIERRSLLIAHKVKNICRKVFRFAVASGYAEGNPMVGLVGALPAIRHTHFEGPTDPRAVASLLNAIDVYQGSVVVKCAMKLALLLMVRSLELHHAEWAEMDFAGAQWVIPAEKMRTRQPHIVPLSRQAISILRDLHRRTGDGRYVFPRAKSPDRCISDHAVSAAFRSMGVGMSSYGCRVIAARILYEVLGCDVEVVERQLAHQAAVGRLMVLHNPPPQPSEQRRDMMQKLADYLDTVKGAAIPVTG